MKYVLLLFNEEYPMPADAAPSPEMMEPWIQFGQEVDRVAKQLAGEALQPSTTATVVSVRDGKRVTTDGPFVETKEQIGGFYVVDCDNLDTALDLASKVPWATTGHIEVRPVMDVG